MNGFLLAESQGELEHHIVRGAPSSVFGVCPHGYAIMGLHFNGIAQSNHFPKDETLNTIIELSLHPLRIINIIRL